MHPREQPVVRHVVDERTQGWSSSKPAQPRWTTARTPARSMTSERADLAASVPSAGCSRSPASRPVRRRGDPGGANWAPSPRTFRVDEPHHPVVGRPVLWVVGHDVGAPRQRHRDRLVEPQVLARWVLTVPGVMKSAAAGDRTRDVQLPLRQSGHLLVVAWVELGTAEESYGQLRAHERAAPTAHRTASTRSSGRERLRRKPAVALASARDVLVEVDGRGDHDLGVAAAGASSSSMRRHTSRPSSPGTPRRAVVGPTAAPTRPPHRGRRRLLRCARRPRSARKRRGTGRRTGRRVEVVVVGSPPPPAGNGQHGERAEEPGHLGADHSDGSDEVPEFDMRRGCPALAMGASTVWRSPQKTLSCPRGAGMLERDPCRVPAAAHEWLGSCAADTCRRRRALCCAVDGGPDRRIMPGSGRASVPERRTSRTASAGSAPTTPVPRRPILPDPRRRAGQAWGMTTTSRIAAPPATRVAMITGGNRGLASPPPDTSGGPG